MNTLDPKSKFKPLIGKKRDRLINDAMKYSKKDLAIMYVDTKWCFYEFVKMVEFHTSITKKAK